MTGNFLVLPCFFNLRRAIDRQRHYLFTLKSLRLVAENIILFFRGIYRSFFSGGTPPKKPCVKAKNEKKVNGWHFFSFVVFFNLRHEINRQRHYLYGLKFLRLVAENIIFFFRGIYRSFFQWGTPPQKKHVLRQKMKKE